MKEIIVRHVQSGDIARTEVSTSSGMSALMLRVGDKTTLTVMGRGNVRLLKEVTRKLAKV
jgi:hypothetical protein